MHDPTDFTFLDCIPLVSAAPACPTLAADGCLDRSPRLRRHGRTNAAGRTISWVSLTAWALGLATACSETTEGPSRMSGRPSSGERSTVLAETLAEDPLPPRDAPLSTLTEAQVEALCQETVSDWELDRVEHATCLFTSALAAASATVFGLEDADMQVAACQEAYDRCEIKPEEVQCDTQRFATCDATLEQLRACQHDQTALLLELLEDKTCADISTDVSAALPAQEPLSEPASCKELAEVCPGLLPSQDAEEAPNCDVQIATAGAVTAEVDVATNLCGHLGDDTGLAALFDDPRNAPLGMVTLDIPAASDVGPEALVRVEVWTADGGASWAGEDCRADVTVEACTTWDDVEGQRYHYDNGSCSTPATASIGDPGGELEVLSFSARSACITW